MTVFGPVTFRSGGIWGFGELQGLPLNGPIASPFGAPRAGGPHTGIDIAAPTGTPILAPAAGEVLRVDTEGLGSSGKHVVLRHPDGMTSSYYHMSAPASLVTGQQIAVGAFLGASGNTGNSTGPHLHWGVFAARTSTPIDPMLAMDGTVSISRGTFVTERGMQKGITPAVWQGGSVAELTAAAKRERAVSVTVFVDGRPLVLIPGARGFVNKAIRERFPVDVPLGTIVFVVTD